MTSRQINIFVKWPQMSRRSLAKKIQFEAIGGCWRPLEANGGFQTIIVDLVCLSRYRYIQILSSLIDQSISKVSRYLRLDRYIKRMFVLRHRVFILLTFSSFFWKQTCNDVQIVLWFYKVRPSTHTALQFCLPAKGLPSLRTPDYLKNPSKQQISTFSSFWRMNV